MPSDGNERKTAVRVTDKSFYALVRSFKESPKFREYSEATQDLWGRELDYACRPNCLGAITTDELRPALVQQYLDGWSDKPGKQAAALAAFKILDKWANVRELLPRPITYGVETGKPEGGHTPWTEEQVTLAEQYARPDIARAITLGANTGQRGSDLVRMGPTDVETYNGVEGINVTQKKTGRVVWVPITSTLAAAMEKWERRAGPFLLTYWGEPWRRQQLTEAWTYERDHNPNLEPLKKEGLVLHGLRGHACVRLLRSGANTRQISDVVGMSEPMVARYTRFSIQRENASAAIYNMERTIQERKLNKSNTGRS